MFATVLWNLLVLFSSVFKLSIFPLKVNNLFKLQQNKNIPSSVFLSCPSDYSRPLCLCLSYTHARTPKASPVRDLKNSDLLRLSMKNYDFTSSHLISSSNTTVIQIKTKKAENLILLFYSWSILFPAALNLYSPSWCADSHPFLSRGGAYVLGLYHETWAQGCIIMSSQKTNTHACKCAFIHHSS